MNKRVYFTCSSLCPLSNNRDEGDKRERVGIKGPTVPHTTTHHHQNTNTDFKTHAKAGEEKR